MAESNVIIVSWTSPFWVCNVFPQPTPDAEVVTLDYIIMALDRHTAHITEADSTPLGAAMHVAHMLMSLQGPDGLWPARINLRTGEAVGDSRSAAPVSMMRRLDELLDANEYEWTIRRAEAAIANGLSHGSDESTDNPTERL
jgi:hypothetical protein